MLEQLKEKVWKANIDLYRSGVVIYTWGNVSQRDPQTGYMVIKPSGIDYDIMKPEDMVVVDIASGKKIEGKWNPSSDTPTHCELYRSFPQIGGICHTHSINAVAFAQAYRDIPALGTTHADVFYGPVLCARCLSEQEVKDDYELNTGKVIVSTIKQQGIDVMANPGILVANHGPFTWGKDGDKAVYNAVCLEKISEMALKSLLLNPDSSMPQYVLDKHYFRKHGPNAYYGQINVEK